jgi:three-Cys-motif partner protein
MSNNFHDEPFDDETILKLEIFGGYIREWLPVFLSKKIFDSVNIFDFFAGPGRDSTGKEGTPLIIINEIDKYVINAKHTLSQDVPINLFFNDVTPQKVALLANEVVKKNIKTSNIKVTNQDFQQCFDSYQSIMNNKSAAKLVILDQCGVKQITPAIFSQLISSPTVDFMFFISSSTFKRFGTLDDIRQYHPNLSPDKTKEISATDIHRFICQYYRGQIPAGKSSYIAPFSIKKGANYYGIIFGTSSLRGLEKFLNVCWNKDSISGEANYDIDDDFVRDGLGLFSEDNIPKKLDVFKSKLVGFLKSNFKTNNELYKFALEYGCLPRQANEVLKELQKEKRLQVKPSDIRKGSFYINWDYYHKQEVKAEFCIRE